MINIYIVGNDEEVVVRFLDNVLVRWSLWEGDDAEYIVYNFKSLLESLGYKVEVEE